MNKTVKYILIGLVIAAAAFLYWKCVYSKKDDKPAVAEEQPADNKPADNETAPQDEAAPEDDTKETRQKPYIRKVVKLNGKTNG